MSYDISYFSEPGPRPRNEDAVLCFEESGLATLAIADGVGGHGGGSTAATIALQVVRSAPPTQSLLCILEAAHEAIVCAQAEAEYPEMATTLTVTRLANGKLLGAHCGDTRCVVQRGDGIKKLTRPHTEAQRLFEAGKLTKKELIKYPRRNILESALGAKTKPTIDTFDFDINNNDRIILTTDGVHEKIFLRELIEICKFERSEKILDALKKKVVEKSPSDNYSAICAIYTNCL